MVFEVRGFLVICSGFSRFGVSGWGFQGFGFGVSGLWVRDSMFCGFVISRAEKSVTLLHILFIISKQIF